MTSLQLKVGDRVRITCADDRMFYRRIGVVTVIETDLSHCNKFYRGRSIFVQMVRSNGGQWWYSKYLKLLPPLRKQAKASNKIK